VGGGFRVRIEKVKKEKVSEGEKKDYLKQQE